MGVQFSCQRWHNKVGNEKNGGTSSGSGIRRALSGSGRGDRTFNDGDEGVSVSVPDARCRQHKSKSKSFHDTLSHVFWRTTSVNDDKVFVCIRG